MFVKTILKRLKIAALLFVSLLPAQDSFSQRTEKLIDMYYQPNSDYVMVIAHRGDWRNSPENSIRSIERVIDMGVDMVELDVQLTKDSVLILMHDQTIDRTTTGKGRVGDMTLAEIKALYLRNASGGPTVMKVPTLEEALLACKDKILVNVDKGYQYFNQVYEVLKKTGTTRQVLIKGNAPYDKLISSNAELVKKTIYMPVIYLERGEAPTIKTFTEKLKPGAFEIVFATDTSAVLDQFMDIRRSGARVWVNTIFASLCAGRDDDKAIEDGDIEGSWGWVVKRGANMIQTDRPKELIEYLRSQKYREGL